MTLDLTNVKVRLALYHFHNRRHDGEVWLWVRHLGRTFPVEQSACPQGAEIFGELEFKIVDDEIVDTVVPVRQRSALDIEAGRRMAEAHKRYRASLYKAYSIEGRIQDLATVSLVES